MFVLEKARSIVEIKKARKLVGREPSDEFYYVICLNNSVEFPLSRWARMLPLTSQNKPHTYISVVVRFCNFLLKRKKRYYEAQPKDIRDFYDNAVFFDKEGHYIETPKILSETIDLYKKALIHFYKYLNDFYDNDIVKSVSVTTDGQAVDVIGELKTRWQDIHKEAEICIKYSISTHKTNDKVYIKEYSDEELATLYHSFKTLMQKAIFLLTLKGMRIDEVLSIKTSDYDPKKMTVQPSRSKGRRRKKSDIRTVVIGPEGVQIISLYLFHERTPALNQILKQGRNGSEYLFVTLRKVNGEIPFTPYTQESFRSALKTAAKCAGIKGEVKPHIGRSQRAIELARLEHQGVITQVQINLIMGWKSLEAHKPYNDHVYKEEAEKILENVQQKRIARLDALIKEQEVGSHE
ncbi:site-specific integrase [Sulfuricurvum sp.]|uniref:tyrosine-type recombinase/integrase n=1 Tax=Sulfuricurvum sp. TaxID=2025608 RepID=UPI00260FB30C|nr:site-specific integrase [Sulfuricurvum sp.]MDD2781782.1 site-specific integrase [Sulfuricurvum sp.]